MTRLRAGQALCGHTVRVNAEARAAEVIAEMEACGATHAVVFDGAHFAGVVSLHRIVAAHAGRIFADLVSRVPPPGVDDASPLQAAAARLREGPFEAIPVFRRKGTQGGEEAETPELCGLITRDSLLSALLAESEAQLGEVQRARLEQERLRLMGEMACGVAHNLNNLLTPVVIELDLLRDADLPEPWSDRARLALRSAADAATAVRRIHDFYDGPNAGAPAGLVELGQIAREVRELAKLKWREEAWRRDRHVALRVETPEEVLVRGHAGELREVVTNLVLNAVDAIPGDGTVVLRTGRRADRAVLEVIDDGAGMTPEQRERCFEPFFTTKGPSGSGVGLAVSRRLVESADGRLTVEAASPRGSIFRVELPAQEATAAEATPPVRDLCARRALVVEDSLPLRTALAQLLEGLGLEAELAASGREGIDALAAGGRYDVVITDLSLPSASGFAVCRAAKAQKERPGVLVVTGWPASMLGPQSWEERGVDHVLEKPFDREQLRRALAEVEQRRARRSGKP